MVYVCDTIKRAELLTLTLGLCVQHDGGEKRGFLDLLGFHADGPVFALAYYGH